MKGPLLGQCFCCSPFSCVWGIKNLWWIFHLKPALPWPILGKVWIYLSTWWMHAVKPVSLVALLHVFLVLNKDPLLCLPCTLGKIVSLILVWDLVWTKYFSLSVSCILEYWICSTFLHIKWYRNDFMWVTSIMI